MWAIVLNDLNSSRFILHEYLSYHVLCHVIMLQYVEGEHHYGEGIFLPAAMVDSEMLQGGLTRCERRREAKPLGGVAESSRGQGSPMKVDCCKLSAFMTNYAKRKGKKWDIPIHLDIVICLDINTYYRH